MVGRDFLRNDLFQDLATSEHHMNHEAIPMSELTHKHSFSPPSFFSGIKIDQRL